MRRALPWIAALITWNVTFDYQLRAAGDVFVAEQMAHHVRGEPPVLIRDGFRPRVGEAALASSGLAGLVLAGTLLSSRRRAKDAHR